MNFHINRNTWLVYFMLVIGSIRSSLVVSFNSQLGHKDGRCLTPRMSSLSIISSAELSCKL